MQSFEKWLAKALEKCRGKIMFCLDNEGRHRDDLSQGTI